MLKNIARYGSTRGNFLRKLDWQTMAPVKSFSKDEEQTAFLHERTDRPSRADWQRAATIVDSVSSAHVSRFDVMSRAGIKADRLRACGLI